MTRKQTAICVLLAGTALALPRCGDGGDMTSGDVSGTDVAAPECTSDAGCDDGVACTDDLCVYGGTCTHVAIDTACEDGEPCTAGRCDAVDGCLFDPIDGQPCDDGDPCTAGDQCVAGLCSAGTQLLCECATDADCASVDDGDPCTGQVVCDTAAEDVTAWRCVVDPDSVPECDPAESTECALHACDPATGLCALAPRDDGSPCDDGDPCTTPGTCDGGACASGEALDCSDGDPCTIDACDVEAGGCTHEPDTTDACACVADADCGALEDGDLCNGTLFCAGGTCAVDPDTVPPPCPAAGDECGVAACDPATGTCGVQPAHDGTPCDDGDPCTTAGACDDGACAPGAALDCTDDNPCTVDACVAGCTNTPQVGAPCDDGDACTAGDACSGDGTCASGAAVACDDGDVCTADSCHTVLGCLHDASGADGTACDDDDPCTTGDACAAGACTGGEPLDCDDGDPCTSDACGATGCFHHADGGPLTPSITGLPESGATSGAVTPAVVVPEPNVVEVTATLDGQPFALGTTIDAPGPHELRATAVNCAGVSFTVSASFVLDATPPVVSASVDPAPNALGWNRQPVTVTFTATDEGSGVAWVTEAITIDSATAGQLVVGQAADAAGNTATTAVTVKLDPAPPVVAITEPLLDTPGAGQLVLGTDSVLVTGVVADDALSGFASASVGSSKGTASLDIEAPGIFSLPVPLHAGTNMVLVRARDQADNVGTAWLTVFRDADAPRVHIQYPPDGFHTSEALVSVTGLANDLVVGTVTEDTLQVTVAGVDAEVDNRQFVAAGVPLALGANTITAVGLDAAGHESQHTITVIRELPAGDRLERVSGDGQTGPVLASLAGPLVVRYLDADGQPVPDQDVVFAVADGGGWLESPAGAAEAPDGRGVLVSTDADGRAEATFTLGKRAGAGLHRVVVSAAGATPVTFCATAVPGAPINLYVHAGDGQAGAIHEPLSSPLSVLVTDAGHNPVAGVPVTFAVIEGDGAVDGASTASATSSSSGLASVIFVPGAVTGPASHRVNAWIPGIKSPEGETPASVRFTATAVVPGDPADTAVAGVVVDQDEQPVAGATIRFPGDPAGVVTGADGTFTYLGAPVGFTVLEVDGTTAVPDDAEWTLPNMHFELHTVPGAVNHLDRPVYLLQLSGGVWVDGLTTQTVEATVLPDFALTVPAGTEVTFPSGESAGVVAITQVHFDQAPMAPMNGLSSRALVTIQPPGVTFDPPAPLTIPNVDGYLPTEKVEMFSYDHDLEAFVAIGTGTVSDDGTVIASDPGVGVVKGGWHCGSNPQGSGASAPVTASLSSSGAGTGPTAELTATGSPGEDTHWEWAVTCGDISVDGGSCEGQTSCTATASASQDAARGKVQVTHICDETGASASDELIVTICDAPTNSEKIEVTFWKNEFTEVVNAATTALEYVGCDIGKPKIELKGEATETEQCCPGCPGVVGTDWDLAITGGAELAGECMTPLGFKFPSSVFDFKFGLFGTAKVSGNVSLGTAVTDCCADPPCFCFKGSVKAGLQVGLKLYVIQAEIFEFSIIDVHGAANTGVSGGFDVSCKQACGSLCWDGLTVEGKIDFLNGAVAYTNSVQLICPKKLLGKCYDFDLPAGAPSSGGCAEANDACGPSGEPGQGPGQPGGGSDPTCGASADCADDAPKCLSSSECDDGDPCNGVELCDPSFGCVPGDEPPECDDGIACTEDECEAFTGCVYEPNDALCPSDFVACTEDVCDPGAGCDYLPDDAACDDGVACTEDTCDATFGCENEPQDAGCGDGVACTADTCDPVADCQNDPQDAECDDGVGCTVDTCDATAGCQSDPDDGQCDDGVSCTVDTCDGAAGCQHDPDDGACSDGVSCTDDTCDAAAGCQHAPDDGQCADGVSCTDDTCDAAAGCQHQPQDAACLDGDVCNGEETCHTTAGCLAGVPLSCDDGDPCTSDSCDPSAGCSHAPIPGCGEDDGGGGGGPCPCDPPSCSGPAELTTWTCVASTCEATVTSCEAGEVCEEADDTAACVEGNP